jgi:hypothetical protein
VEAQFQTALDMLVETHTEATSPQVGNIDVSNAMDNKDGTAEHNPEDSNYYFDSMAPHKSFNETGCDITSSGQGLSQICRSKVENREGCYPEDTKILSKGLNHQTPNTEEHMESWQTKICENTANIKERHTPPQHNRRYLCYVI